ncbi:MAG TPA: class I SAM-dependent methyltransferase, partial [Longimicrobiaceae bacterium]
AGAHLGHLLDLGCGTASLLPRLAEWGAGVEHYVGVDLTPEMLLGARAKLAAAPFPAALVAADAGALPTPPAPIQTVVSASALHDWEHPEAALAEVRRVLGEGGRFILLDWCRDSLGMKVMDAALRIARNPFRHMYSRDEAAALLSGAGFRIVRERVASIRFPWRLMVFDTVKG